jgi:hypothetical protein
MLPPMARRTVAALVLALALIVVGPGSAEAGIYTVHACRTPDGNPAPADGWTVSVVGSFMFAGNACPTGQLSAAADTSVVHPPGSLLAIRFDAPQQTRIASFEVRRNVRVSRAGDGAWNYTSFYDGIAFGTDLQKETCWSTNGCTQLAASAPWTGTGPAAALALLIDCSSGPNRDCQPGSAAEMGVTSAAITLEDRSDPVFAGAPTGSALDGTHELRGLVGASFGATDAGGGVARAVLEVDGVAVAEQPLGGCAPPYTQVVPCRPSASGSLSWDTRSAPNGSHQVRVLVYDATGTNHAAAGPFAVRVRNRGALACGTSGLRIEAGWKGRARRTVGFRRRSTVSGRVLGPGGAPAAGAQVVLYDARTGRRLRATAAGAGGRYKLRAPATRNRVLRVGVQADAATLSCSRPLTLRVRAGLSLTVRPRALRNGERVRLSGRVRGGAIPPKGKLVELQALEGGDWRTFASLRTDKRGRFATRYRFQRTFTTRTYRFRARARAEARFPFVLGMSRAVPVRVTP